MSRLPAAPQVGAVVYSPEHPPEDLLTGFAADLAARGFTIGGLAQKTRPGVEGCRCAMEVVELDTGRRISIAQDLGAGSMSCALDPSALADASAAVRRAVAQRVDLLFINKFSKAERSGRGLATEMLSAMAEGVPLLTAVPGIFMDDWTTFTGGRGQVLMPTEEALWRWWGPARLYDDLALGVGDEPASRVVVGPNWIMVEGRHGVGLAQMPEGATVEGDGWTGQPLSRLAALVRSWQPGEVALGMAAINAHYNRFDLAAADGNGLDILDCEPAATVVIGGFPGIAERLPGTRIIERRPAPGQYPEDAATWLVPAAEGVVITASTLANRSLPGLLRLAEGIPVALVGPSATLTPRLFSYGVTASAGFVVTDPDGLAHAVTQGCTGKALKRFGRQAVVTRE